MEPTSILDLLLQFVDVVPVAGIMIMSLVFRGYLGKHVVLLPLGLGMIYGSLVALSSITPEQNTITIVKEILKTGLGYGGASAILYKIGRTYKWFRNAFNGNGVTAPVDTTSITEGTPTNGN